MLPKAKIHCSSMLLIFMLTMILLPRLASAQRPKPKTHGVYDGDTMFTVLPPGAIPAIMEPEFVKGTEAEAQMSPDEPVLGIVINNEARAYSLWHLDAHEIVNDVIGGTAIAATW